ncbi:Os06g0698785 [Oryza sativa Japonica Group]|uniref:Os06g0698785 protein n=1 Tax=Oryza sativa subsp. japonica TaxID=39947 RepID=A0A0P0X0M6_ORYSJ|nr:hypothetical protein EE612_036280 [Oryza sativa]BAS99315.1 Os06g0698785 [Oryza sativa Japonica Group]
MAIAQSAAAVSSAARASRPRPTRAAPRRIAASASSVAPPEPAARRLVAAFDPAVPLASAVTPPSGWYTDPDFLRLELDRVFLRGWQAVGIYSRFRTLPTPLLHLFLVSARLVGC